MKFCTPNIQVYSSLTLGVQHHFGKIATPLYWDILFGANTRWKTGENIYRFCDDADALGKGV